MRLVPTRRIQPGAVTACDIQTGHPSGIPLLRAGAVLTSEFLTRLQRMGIHAVWVSDALSDGVTPETFLDEQLRATASRAMVNTMAEARNALKHNAKLDVSTLNEITDAVDAIAERIMECPITAMVMSDLAAGDSYTHRHSANVTALGLLIAKHHWEENGWVDWAGERHYDRIAWRLGRLGLGLMLHDVGKMVVPEHILNKPSKLDASEWELMRTHPEAGLSLLPGDTFPREIRQVVEYHHEQWAGGGYPRGLMGVKIPELARIAAIADVYDAVTSARPYKGAEPAHVGVRVITEGSGTRFDPDLVETFSKLVFPYPPGSDLVLADGREAVVVSVEKDTPYQPVVRVPAGDGFDEFSYDTTKDPVLTAPLTV